MALVADDGEEFYGIYDIPANPHPWVAQNVLPAIALIPHETSGKFDFKRRFCKFVYKYKDAEIVADWPADIEHFCSLLTFMGSKNGWRIPANYRFRLIDRANDYKSEIEHNALSDARALRDYCNDWKI